MSDLVVIIIKTNILNPQAEVILAKVWLHCLRPFGFRLPKT
jgi:hypothetical protein